MNHLRPDELDLDGPECGMGDAVLWLLTLPLAVVRHAWRLAWR